MNAAAKPRGSAFTFPTIAPAGFCDVASFKDFGLNTAGQIDKNGNIHANIQNVFGREPPLDLQTYASTNFNPSLHREGAIGRFVNVGFRYGFLADVAAARVAGRRLPPLARGAIRPGRPWRAVG